VGVERLLNVDDAIQTEIYLLSEASTTLMYACLVELYAMDIPAAQNALAPLAQYAGCVS
jgi:hypothetical protein